METLKFVIIDDDVQAHNVISKLMEIHKSYKCVGEYYDVISAIDSIKEVKPDFIFLDIDMPNLNGFELLKYIDKSIKVIVTTSHRNYAVDGFDRGINDFLTKPIRQERLFEALNRITSAIETEAKLKGGLYINQLKRSTTSNVSYICASRLREKSIIQIEKKEIYYITKTGNHIEIFTDTDGPFYKIGSLKEIMEALPENEFSFANQSFVLNIKKVKSLDGETIVLNNEDETLIKISPAYRDVFRKK
ncbi:MAG: LytTR family DNA-binding domain-containing protein [Bacteroidetes bacterium]|nr:LytTR family DNA-binding domain-containing protein [Bacteroidota bacterium]